MGFLDNIGQRPSESRPTASRPSVAENLTRRDAAEPVRTAPAARDSSQPNRIHPLVIWSAVLVVVAAIAAGAWLGLRHSAMFSPDTETKAAADASPEAAQPVPQPTQKRDSARSQPVGRRASRSGTATTSAAASGESSVEAEVPAIAPVSQAADLAETTTTQVEAASDPILAVSTPPLSEDDYVYSSEGGGVIAPRLTSLGFVRRLVSGLRVRTSTIELVVSKDGTVERAKIFSTPAHWEDALLLSRAKMLQFVPAYRNGFPVRYRFVMDVDTSP
jgi:hypothetical protein